MPCRHYGGTEVPQASSRSSGIAQNRDSTNGISYAIRTFFAAVAGALLSRWPRPTQASGGSTSFDSGYQAHPALSILKQDANALQEALPDFLLKIRGPEAAPMLVDDTGQLVFPTEERGPWDMEVVLAGNPEDEIYHGPVRVRLRFDAAWPLEPPSIRILGLLSYAMLDRSRSPPRDFFGRLEKDSAGRLALANLLEHLRGFLLDPLEALGITPEGEDTVSARKVRIWARDVRTVNKKRVSVISRYARVAKHPMLFEPTGRLRAEWFPPELWEAATRGTPERWHSLLTEHLPGKVYSFPLFTDAFCDTLLEEIFGFYATGLPARRPNSMNAYGIILSDIGLEPFVDELQRFLQPLGSLLFPGAGNAWDGHHCFVVRYREGEDLGLDMHTDDSDVTFNVCLGLEFTGAGLQFCGSMGSPVHRQHSFTYLHKKGHCVVHLGRQRHGADDIRSGERLNLILWNHSSTYRGSEVYRHPSYHPEAGPPSPLCVSYTHDRDFGVFKPYPAGKEAFRSRGWCPPPNAEYEGFKADKKPTESLAQTLSKL